MFIARVSRGRTIREFVTGVLFVPAGFTLMWMTVFGNSAIYLIMHQGDLANTVQQDVALALFNFLEHFRFFRAVIYCNGDGHCLLCHLG
jgi:choline/glycine/proline betaine transport protein